MKNINSIKFFILCIVASILTVYAFQTSYTKEYDGFEVVFLDVGQGDCAYIKTPDNFRILIDSGDVGSYDNYIKKFLGSRKIEYINAAVVSHFDADHFYGLYEMIGKKRVDKVYIPENSISNLISDKLFETCVNNDVPCESVKVGDIIYDGRDGVKIWALFPNEFIYDSSYDKTKNNECIVIMAEYKDKKFLFMGDIEKEAEKAICSYMDVDADVLKVGHHGSSNSSSALLISSVSPKYSVISCGINNDYGHPDPDVVKNLEDFGSRVYRTDHDGNITFLVDDNGNISVKTSKQGD